MGNVSHRFLTIFLTLFLPLIIFVNLIAFGNVFGLEVFEGNKYFGVSSIFESLSYFQSATQMSGFGVFDPQHMNEFAIRGLDHFTFGVPKLFEGLVNGDMYARLFDGRMFDFSDFPRPNDYLYVTFDTSDILKLLTDFVHYISSWFEYFGVILNWLTDKLGIITYLVRFVVTLILQPVLVLFDMFFIFVYILYYLLILVVWVIKLINGAYVKDMPSNSDSRWTSMINDWEDTWSSIVPQAKVFLPPLQCVC